MKNASLQNIRHWLKVPCNLFQFSIQNEIILHDLEEGKT